MKESEANLCQAHRLLAIFMNMAMNKVHTPTNALFIKPDKSFKIYVKNHFDLLLHASV